MKESKHPRAIPTKMNWMAKGELERIRGVFSLLWKISVMILREGKRIPRKDSKTGI